MIIDVRNKKCVPCEGNVPPLTSEQSAEYLKQVSGWTAGNNGKIIRKEFPFPDFLHTMQFANKIAEIAEAEGHHPDLHISYSKIVVELTTHSIDGLSENDFILAAKIDDLQK